MLITVCTVCHIEIAISYIYLHVYFQNDDICYLPMDDFAGDKKLVQSLVLDALVTDGFNKRGAMHKEENQK